MVMQDEVEDQLKALDAGIRLCTSCTEREQFPGTLPTVQYRKCQGILFVGREPAKDGWRKSGRAFHKQDGTLLPSGVIFRNQLNQVGLTIEDVNFVELVKCFPSRGRIRPPRKIEIQNCKHWLDRQRDILKPKVIVPMGKECYEFFRGRKVGSFLSCIERREMVYYRGDSVVPIFHPSGANQKYNWMNVDILKGIVEEFGGDQMVLADDDSVLWRIREILEKGWSEDTTYDKEGYEKKNCRSWGQCYVTARALNRVFEWEILHLRSKKEDINHYWNGMPDGREIDFTSDQFEGNGLNKIEDWKGWPVQYRSKNTRLRRYLKVIEEPLRRLKEELR